MFILMIINNKLLIKIKLYFLINNKKILQKHFNCKAVQQKVN